MNKGFSKISAITDNTAPVFSPQGKVNRITVARNDAMILIHEIILDDDFNTSTQPTVLLSGQEYAVWARADNANVFNMYANTSVSLSRAVCTYNNKALTATYIGTVILYIGYDGVNTYIFTSRGSLSNLERNGRISGCMRLYPGYPKNI